MRSPKRAVLLFNPLSGRGRNQRRPVVERAAELLRSQGDEVRLVETAGPGSAGAQAAEAVAAGAETIYACGGDGTVHDILQGMVAQAPEVPIGILPLGTGNVLAYDLRLSSSAERAALQLLSYVPRRIAAGRVDFRSKTGEPESRYFCVTAGIGVDAEMLYLVTAESKHRWGLLAYSWQMLRMALSHRFEHFDLEWRNGAVDRTSGSGSESEWQRTSVAQLLAVRVGLFGPMLRRMAPDASLGRNDLQAILYETSQPLRYLQQVAAAFLGRRWNVPGIRHVGATHIVCRSLKDGKPNERVYVEADGEVLGRLPASITIVPQAFTLLMPE